MRVPEWCAWIINEAKTWFGDVACIVNIRTAQSSTSYKHYYYADLILILQPLTRPIQPLTISLCLQTFTNIVLCASNIVSSWHGQSKFCILAYRPTESIGVTQLKHMQLTYTPLLFTWVIRAIRKPLTFRQRYFVTHVMAFLTRRKQPLSTENKSFNPHCALQFDFLIFTYGLSRPSAHLLQWCINSGQFHISSAYSVTMPEGWVLSPLVNFSTFQLSY